MARSPLLDLYDPYGILEEQAKLGLLPGQDPLAGGGRLTIADLMAPEEKKSALRALAGRRTSGLAFAADTLDTLGAGVRGALVGKPFSVLGEGISGDQRVTGRDVLRHYGLASDEDTWGNFAGGLAVEILTDPLTYLNPFAMLGKGAATLAGKAGAKAGLTRMGLDAAADAAGKGTREFYRTAKASDYLDFLAKNVSEEAAESARDKYLRLYERMGGKGNALDEVLGADMTFGIPGLPQFDRTVLGNTGIGGKLDRLGEAAAKSSVLGPVVGRMGALFNSDLKGAYVAGDPETNYALQKAIRGQTQRGRLTADEAVREFTEKYANAEGLGQFAVGDATYSIRSPEVQRFLYDIAEDASIEPTTGLVTNSRRIIDDPMFAVVRDTPELKSLSDYLVEYGARERDRLIEAGIDPRKFESENFAGQLNYIPRQRFEFNVERLPEGVTGKGPSPYARNRRIIDSNNLRGRRDYLDMPQWIVRGLTQGKYGGELAERLRSVGDDQVAEILDEAFRDVSKLDRGVYDGWAQKFKSGDEYQEALASAALGDGKALAELDKRLQAGLKGRYVQLADMLRNLDTQFATENVGFFDAPMYDTISRGLRAGAESRESAQAALDYLRNSGRIVNAAPDIVEGGQHTSLKKLAEDLRLNPRDARVQEALGDDLLNASVPNRVAEALKKASPNYKSEEPISGLASLLRSYTNAWKGLTVLSPAHITRNLVSGLYGGAAMGAVNPLDYLAASRLSAGNPKPLINRLRNSPGFEGLSDDAILNKFQSLAGQTQVFGGNVLDDIGGGQTRLAPGGKLDKLAARKSLAKKTTGQRVREFFGMRGVGSQKASTNPVMKMFDRVNTGVEDTLRGGMFLNQIRKGGDAGAAADLVRLAQVDYRPQAFTPFENAYLRSGAVPFYSFQRGIIPSIATQLAQQPGGLMGQTLRLINRGGQPSEESFLPEHLRSQGAIPLPLAWSPEGKRRNVTSFGLPFESFFNLVTPGTSASDTLGNTLANLAGQSHPLAKYLIEQATGKQLFSGRDLKDLYSVLETQAGLGPAGRPIQQAITNLVPFGSRAISLLQQVTDNRLNPVDKYTKMLVNNVAPFRITDVDPEKARDRAARDMLNDLLQQTPGVRTYENVTVPEEDLRQMSKEQQDMYLLYRVIQSEAQKRARERKKAEEAAALLGVLPPAG